MADYDDIFDIDNMTSGVIDKDGVLDIQLPPSKDVVPMENVLGGASVAEHIKDTLKNYPEDIDVADPLGLMPWRTKEQQEASTVPLDEAYKVGADFFYKIGNQFPEYVDNNKYMQLSNTMRGLSAGAKLMWKDVHQIFGKMEMGQDITAMEGATALFSLADVSIAGAPLKRAPQVFEKVVGWLGKLGVKENAPGKALNIISKNPNQIDEYLSATNIEDLSDEAYDKLNMSAAVPPRKTTAKAVDEVTVTDDVMEQGDDFIDDLELNIRQTKTPIDPTAPKETPDPYLAPERNIRTTTYKDAKKKRKKIDSVKEIEEFTTYKDLPSNTFLGQSINPERLKVVRKYAKIINSNDPAKISALYLKVSDIQRQALRAAALKQQLITNQQIQTADRLFRQTATKPILRNDDLIIRAGNQFEKWKAGELPGVTTKGTTKSSMGAREFIRMLKDDPELDKLIGEEFAIPPGTYEGPKKLKNLTNEERWLQNRIYKLDPILYGLKEQTDKFPFVKPRALRISSEIKQTKRPFQKAVRESIEISRLEANNQLKKAVQEKGGDLLEKSKWATKSKDWINKGAERIAEMGASPTQITNQLKKIDMDKLSDLIVQREKFNIERQFYNEELADVSTMFGDGELPFDAVQIGHFEAVEENIKRAMDIDNLFLQGWKANRAEQDIRLQVKQLRKIFREAKTGDEKRDAITKLMDIDKQLADSGSISKIGGQDFGAWPDEDFLAVGEDVMDEMSFARGGVVEDEMFEEQVSENRGTPTIDMTEESIFDDDASYETANLILPFFKLFGKAPVNTYAPLPIPKSELDEVSKLTPKPDGTLRPKQQSLKKIQEAEDDIFDPTPDTPIEVADPTKQIQADIAITPYTNKPSTSVFYSDIERALSRPDAPKQFSSKEEVLDFFQKNNIKGSEQTDYRIPNILQLFPDNTPIPTSQLIAQVRQAPIAGIRVHGTGMNSELVNPQGFVRAGHDHYYEPGSLPNTYRERVLMIPKKNLPGDTGKLPERFSGEGAAAPAHDFGQGNDNYVIGWSRLTDRMGFIPPKIASPQTSKSAITKMKKNINKLQAQQSGLFAEAQSKIQRLGFQKGFNQADIDELLIDSIEDVVKYKNQLDEISPGMVDQMDELSGSINKLKTDIAKAETPSAEGFVRVTFADEIQSDLLQEAALRKQYLGQSLKKLMDEGKTVTDIREYDSLNKKLMQFYEENKSVFRPQTKTAAEVDVLRTQLTQMDEKVDNIINKYIATREISEKELKELGTMLEDNMSDMLDSISTLDESTMNKLFPDIPFKNRDEWGDAVIKKDLYEAAYRKFVLKDPDAADYYAVSPSDLVKKRYSFSGGTDTPTAQRIAEKNRQMEEFLNSGEVADSKLKGVGMDEFYGGPNVKATKKFYVYDESKPIKEKVLNDMGKPVMGKDGKPKTKIVGYQRVKAFKPTEEPGPASAFVAQQNNPNYKIQDEQLHYTGSLEKILQKQAKENNSEFLTMPVQLKAGGKNVYKVTDQNGNMVATLTNVNQATELIRTNPRYKVTPISMPDEKAMQPVFAIKITKEMLEPYVTHKAMGGLVENVDIFEV